MGENDQKSKLKADPQFMENVAGTVNKTLGTGVSSEGSVKTATEAAQNFKKAWDIKGANINAYADALHDAHQANSQGEVLNPAQKAENDTRETMDRVDKAKQLYQQEKNAIEEQQRSQDYQKQSFEQKAKDLNDQFEKSNQKQLDYKNQQDRKYQELAGEHAKVSKDLTALNESARQEHAQWRENKVDGLVKDEATAQVNHKIEERVGQYQNRLNEMGSKFTDGPAMVDKYKVQLEEKKPGQIEQRAAEMKQDNFKSMQPPTMAAPSMGPEKSAPAMAGPTMTGPGGGGPGGR